MHAKKIVLGTVFALATASLLLSCGEPEILDVNGDGTDDGQAATTVIAPSNPVGTITGMVFDAKTQRPLPSGKSFKVTLVAGSYGDANIGRSVEIEDGTGFYRFEEVPAGVNVTIEVSAEGYSTGYAQVTLNASAGDFPAGNAHAAAPTVELVEQNGSLEVMVVAVDGRLLLDVDVFLDIDFSYIVNGVVSGHFSAATRTVEGNSGLATFENIPNAAALAYRLGGRHLVVTVPPIDADGDGNPEYRGAVQSITLMDAAIRTDPVTIVVDYPTGQDDVQIIASNLADLVSTNSTPVPRPIPSVLTTEAQSLFIAFNQPVDAGSFLVLMVAEMGGDYFALNLDSEIFNEAMSIAEVPLPETLREGREYNVYVEARPAMIGSSSAYRGAAAFFVKASSDIVKVDRAIHQEMSISANHSKIDANDNIWFELNMPVGARDDSGAISGFVRGDAYGNLLPIRVQVSGVNLGEEGPDLPIEQGYDGDADIPEAHLVEIHPSGLFVRSGYTSIVRFTIPAGVEFIRNGTVGWHFTFNDSRDASAQQNLRAASPSGLLPGTINFIDTLTFDPDYTSQGQDAGMPEDAN